MTRFGDALRALIRPQGPAGQDLVGGFGGWGAIHAPTGVSLTGGVDGSRVVSFEGIYRSQPAVSAVINKITRQVVRLPLRAFEGDPDGDFEPLPGSHSLSGLLNRPAERKGKAYLKQALILPVLAHGNSTIVKYRGDGDGRPPTELFRLDWAYMSAYANPGGWIRQWTTRQIGREVALDPEAVVHVAWESPSGPLGISPLEQLGATVSLEDAARRYQKASFRNGVRPSGALTLPTGEETTVEERQEMRQEIDRMHSGVDNAFRLALLTGGAQFQPMSFNAQEAALIEARTLNREEVCMVYDMPPPLVGDFTRATYSNVEETNRALYKIHIPPWLALCEDALQSQLIDPEPEWDDCFVRFDLSEALKGDPAAEATAQSALVTNGIITRDEARQRLGLRRAGGAAGELMYPANNEQPLADLDKAPTGELPPPEPSG